MSAERSSRGDQVSAFDRAAGRIRRIDRVAYLPLALLVASIWLLLVSPACSPMVDPHNVQDQTTTPSERLGDGQTIAQTFVAHQNGLAAIDLVVARYPDQPAADLVLSLRLDQPDAPALGTRIVPSTTTHNERVRFSIPPQPDSAGKTYRLETASASSEPNGLTVWATGEPVYPDGQRYYNGEPVPGALSFRTFYQYDARALLADLLRLSQQTVAPVFIALVLLVLPGAALTILTLQDVGLDPSERLGVAIGASVAFWAVVLWFTTLLQASLNGAAVVAVVVVSTGAIIATSRRLRHSRLLTTLRLTIDRDDRGSPTVIPNEATVVSPSEVPVASPNEATGVVPNDAPVVIPNEVRNLSAAATSPEATYPEPRRLWTLRAQPEISVAVFLIGAVALALRLIVIRDLAWPLWVDSVHHTLIAQEISALGRVPENYGPFVPEQPFTYHFGFHSLVAIVHWLSGAEIPWLVLIIGQLLSGLIVFPVYLIATRLFQSRSAGLVAAACVGCLSTMPAYYVSWGRYPQLAGLVVLPVAYLALRWAIDACPSASTRGGRLLFAVLLAAGQVLTHPRVALLFAALVAAYLVVTTVEGLVKSGQGISSWRDLLGPWIATASVACLSAVALWPWLSRLTRSPLGGYLLEGSEAPPVLFTLPVYGRYDGILVALAALGIVAGLWRKRQATVTLMLWLAVVWLLANPRALGISIYLFLSNSSVEIALFLPIALAVSILVSQVGDLLERFGSPVAQRLTVAASLGAILLASGSMLDVVNPGTILYTRSDIAALAWMRENLPSDARILINAARWQGNIYAGTDGGYWIPAIAQRTTTTPPLVYHDAQPDGARAVGTVSAVVEQWQSDPASLDELIRQQGITHIYVGARRGTLMSSFLSESGYPRVYQSGRSWLFDARPIATREGHPE